MNFKNQRWVASTDYSVGQQVLDYRFQIEVVTTAGMSKAGAPPTGAQLWALLRRTTRCGGGTRAHRFQPMPPGYQPASASGIGTVILDSNNNIQWVVTSGTSRTALQGHPIWSAAVFGLTADNTVRGAISGSVATASPPPLGVPAGSS